MGRTRRSSRSASPARARSWCPRTSPTWRSGPPSCWPAPTGRTTRSASACRSRSPSRWPAGLAGGSSNGAAALLACAVLWDIDISSEAMRALAAELGSDVPFALLGGTAVGRGRGEEVAPALARGTYHWVLAFGHHGLSTPAVYRRFDQLSPQPPAPEVPADLMNALRSGDAKLLGAALVNDLQPAAVDLQPRLNLVLEAGLEYGALGALVSGSGPDLRVPGRLRVGRGRPERRPQRRRAVPGRTPGHRTGVRRPGHRLSSSPAASGPAGPGPPRPARRAWPARRPAGRPGWRPPSPGPGRSAGPGRRGRRPDAPPG